jgi:hypothetical protein
MATNDFGFGIIGDGVYGGYFRLKTITTQTYDMKPSDTGILATFDGETTISCLKASLFPGKILVIISGDDEGVSLTPYSGDSIGAGATDAALSVTGAEMLISDGVSKWYSLSTKA